MFNHSDPEFDIDALLTALAPVLKSLCGFCCSVEALETRAGTFNRVVKFTCGGRHLGVRVMLDSRRFRYEKQIVKEVFAIALLNRVGETIDDDAAGRIVESLLAAPVGGPLTHPAVRSVLHYDWSLSLLPYPFFIFEWIEGRVLWEEPVADHYHQSGRLLASLHQVRFQHFYENIFAIHHVPRSWRDHLRVCLNRELARAEFGLPDQLAARLAAMDLSQLPPGRPCLIHNDFSGGNIVIDEGGAAHAIDWDNWLVDCAELDLVKMKYWTAIGREGRLTHRSGLYDAFLQGYAAAGGTVDPERLRAYEHLWLLRCFNFETTSAVLGEPPSEIDSWRRLYPDAGYYLDLLRDL